MTPDTQQTVYDKDGNPIVVNKQQFEQAVVDTTQQPMPAADQAPQVVYMARPHEPVKPVISEEVQRKHEESKKTFPFLNLSEGEYVISAIRRHPIGLLQIWGVAAVAILALTAAIIFSMSTSLGDSGVIASSSTPWLAMILLCLIALVFMGGVVATVVYEGNRFFLTNESVTQHIQTSLFAQKEQTISLLNIEDASFRKQGLLQTFLNYGSLRLSTQGDETTYRFNFVSDPGQQVALLNNAVEAFKNGRPIDPSEF